MTRDFPIFGVAAEFDDPRALVDAARYTKEHGYQRMEAYTPYPIKELDEIIEAFNPLPAMVFTGGALGAATAWVMQYYIAAIDYPINVGGRPLYSWPAFIVILFELTVLFAACAAFFGTWLLAGLPRPNHPVFNVSAFAGASRDRFFLCIEAVDGAFDSADVAALLAASSLWRYGKLKTPKSLALCFALVAVLAGCRQDMQDEPKYKPLQGSRFFSDGRSARPIPSGTVAIDELDATDVLHTGLDESYLDSTDPAWM